jgi:hypothetical protein
MSTISLTLQGKGGVGKSLVSALIAQYKREKGHHVVCVDTDPVNNSFTQYKAFDTQRIELMEGSKINERHFDDLMEMIFGSEADFVIDNGASCFVPLSSYLVENRAIEMLVEAGKTVVVHPVITGGQALIDTLSGFNRLASQFPEQAGMIVWLNEYFGPIADQGKDFEDMKAFQNHKDRVKGIVRIPKQNGDTFGKDVETMLESKWTFDEAIASDEFQLMAKQRLRMVKRHLFQQMDVVDL